MKLPNSICCLALPLIVGCMLFGFSMHAQVSDDTITYSIDIDDVVITGQYAPTNYRKAIHKVEVIDQKEIETLGRTQLQEVLATLPNVRLTYDPILGTSISLRGIASDNINVLIDGVPVIGRLDGALDISQVNLADIDRIEIIEGPLSTLYGNNAAGGVINIITKKTQANEWLLTLDGQYEAPGIENYMAKIGYHKNKWTLGASTTYLKHQLYPLDSTRIIETIQLDSTSSFMIKKYPWNPKQRNNYNLSAGYEISEDHRLTYKWDLSKEEVQNLGNIRRPQFLPYAIDNLYKTKRQDHTLIYNGLIDSKYFLNVALAQNNFDREVQYNRYEFEPDTINTLLSTADSLKFISNFAKIDLASDLDGRFNFLGGINYISEKGKGDRLLDVENTDSTTVSISDLAFFGSSKIDLFKGMVVNVSGRLSYNSNYNTPFIPAIQFLFNPSENLNFRLGYAHGFRAPTLKELYLNFIDTQHFVLGNPSLQPEASTDLSFSMSYQMKKNLWNLNMDLAVYQNRIKDKIVLVEYDFFKFNYDNIEQFSSKGLNLSASINRKALRISSSMGIGLRSNNLESIEKDSRVIDFQNEISYTFPYGIESNLQHRYVGATPKFQLQGEDIVQNTTRAYNLVDLSLSRAFKGQMMRFTIGAKNILNVQRVAIDGQSLNTGLHITSSPIQLVNQGRTLFAKFTLRIGR